MIVTGNIYGIKNSSKNQTGASKVVSVGKTILHDVSNFKTKKQMAEYGLKYNVELDSKKTIKEMYAQLRAELG